MKEDFFDLTELVRSLQRAEGKLDCFRQPSDLCDSLDCPWRYLCLAAEMTESPDEAL